MFKRYQEWKLRRQRRRLLLPLLAEIEKNLERYYVMYQIERLRVFDLSVWENMRQDPGWQFPEEMETYAQRINAYHGALSAFQDYEKWYTSDSKNKTRENAVRLHQKKEQARDRFQGLEAVIQAALASCRRYGRETGILQSRV